MQTFVPKSRKPKFELALTISDLNNVPLVSGTSFVKWHIQHSSAAEHRGRTKKCVIKEHKVSYGYEIELSVRLTIDKNGVLEESYIYFEILQEYSSGGRGERILLGHVKLNLAEYVELSESEGTEGVVRRYLMQESKINSTLKIGISMRQIDGDRSFAAPPLKSAQVFNGIAGIMVGEQVDSENAENAPSLSHKSREAGELQDMYRRTLAAYWAAQPGELKADDCIEDIFAGGDGWGDRDKLYDSTNDNSTYGDESGSVSGSDAQPQRQQNRHVSPRFVDNHELQPNTYQRRHTVRSTGDGVQGRSSLEQQASHLKAGAGKSETKSAGEVNEFDIRDDLRSWKFS